MKRLYRNTGKTSGICKIRKRPAPYLREGRDAKPKLGSYKNNDTAQ